MRFVSALTVCFGQLVMKTLMYKSECGSQWRWPTLSTVLQTMTCILDHQKIDSALVVGELIQSGAGLIGAVEAVLVFDAADSSYIQQFCILLALLLGHKYWPDILFQVQLAATVSLWAFDGVCFVLDAGPKAINTATSQSIWSKHVVLPPTPLFCHFAALAWLLVLM